MPVRQRAILIAAGAGGGIPTRPGRCSYADGYAAGSAGSEDRRTVSVELIILIIVLLLLFCGGGFYIYRGGWWGPARGNRNAGPVGNPLAIISVVVLIIVFVVWRLILLLR